MQHSSGLISTILSFFSESREDHLKYIEIVFKRDAQLKLHKKKCSFGSANIEYLGHKVGLNKVEPGEVNVRQCFTLQHLQTGNSYPRFWD